MTSTDSQFVAYSAEDSPAESEQTEGCAPINSSEDESVGSSSDETEEDDEAEEELGDDEEKPSWGRGSRKQQIHLKTRHNQEPSLDQADSGTTSTAVAGACVEPVSVTVPPSTASNIPFQRSAKESEAPYFQGIYRSRKVGEKSSFDSATFPFSEEKDRERRIMARFELVFPTREYDHSLSVPRVAENFISEFREYLVLL
eukprot:gene5284-3789_t